METGCLTHGCHWMKCFIAVLLCNEKWCWSYFLWLDFVDGGGCFLCVATTWVPWSLIFRVDCWLSYSPLALACSLSLKRALAIQPPFALWSRMTIAALLACHAPQNRWYPTGRLLMKSPAALGTPSASQWDGDWIGFPIMINGFCPLVELHNPPSGWKTHYGPSGGGGIGFDSMAVSCTSSSG